MKKIIHFLVVVGVLLLGFWGCKEKETQSPKVVFVQGNVTLDNIPLKQGASIANGTKIKMDPKSYVDIQLPDGSLVRLKDAVASLDWKEGDTEWKLTSGSIYSSVVRKKKTDDFRIVTPTSVMGVRGTKFMAEEKTDKTYICVCEGSVGARFKDGSDEKIVSIGQDLYLTQGKDLEDPVDSPDMKKMTDEVFLDMENNLK